MKTFLFLRFAMKAVGVVLLVAVIVNLGSAQLRPGVVQQRQAPIEWRSTKVSFCWQSPHSSVIVYSLGEMDQLFLMLIF